MAKRKSHDSNGPQIKKKFNIKDLFAFKPLTENQKLLFDTWKEHSSLSFFLYGSAGTGKTFSAMYLALADLLKDNSTYEKIIIIRSTVPARDVGFLPGDIEEKVQAYEEPYASICDELFQWSNSYDNLKKINKIKFMPTSFLRGTTFDNAIVIVDEMQNMTYQELDTIMTRIGTNSKVFFCGDFKQSDLIYKKHDTSGFTDFARVIESMNDYFFKIGFTQKDIVRSGIVKDYIMKKEKILD